MFITGDVKSLPFLLTVATAVDHRKRRQLSKQISNVNMEVKTRE